jgi:hypothetical protein
VRAISCADVAFRAAGIDPRGSARDVRIDIALLPGDDGGPIHGQ